MTLFVEQNGLEVTSRLVPDGDFEWLIGRQDGCDVHLGANEVSRRHATLSRVSGTLVVTDAGSRGGTWVADVRLDGPYVIAEDEKFRVGPYILRVSAQANVPPEREPLTPAVKPAVKPHPPLQKQASPAAEEARQESACQESEGPDPLPEELAPIFANAGLLYTDANMALTHRLHVNILHSMNLSEDAVKDSADEAMMAKLETCVDDTLKQYRHELPPQIPIPVFRQALMDELVGYGPLSPILRSPKISEIMVNGPDRIFVEFKGKLTESGVRFFNERHLIQIIQRIVEPLGRHVDDASPMVDARLPDGSRVNAVIPPLALDGASLTIRKFSDKKLTTDDLIGFGSMTKEMALFLQEAVRSRQNILVSGGTGSGKTTLLNVLSQFIPRGERVVTVEDSAELKLSHRNIVRLEARPANIEGKGRIAIRDLVINCLRMRPDRIIVGECRGAEALDMLQAMNTGHDGSLTTAHAHNPRD